MQKNKNLFWGIVTLVIINAAIIAVMFMANSFHMSNGSEYEKEANAIETVDNGALENNSIDLKAIEEQFPSKNIYATSREISIEEIYESYGFTDEDRRVPLTKDKSGELNSDINKEYIYDRMLNSIDYFDSIEGQFYYVSSRNTNKSHVVDYHIRFGSDRRSVETVCKEDGQIISIMELADNTVNNYNAKDVTPLNEALDFYMTSEMVSNAVALSKRKSVNDYYMQDSYSLLSRKGDERDETALVKSRNRVWVDNEGINTYMYRGDYIGILSARESVMPQERIFGFLSDFDQWNIEKNETFLGRSVFVLSGYLSGSYGDKMQIDDFKMWVDEETGVMLKFEGYNGQGELIEKLETTQISIDKPIGDSAFKLPSGNN